MEEKIEEKEEKNVRMGKTEKSIFMGIFMFLIVFVVVILGVSFAYWTATASQSTTNTITTDCLNITLTDDSNNGALTLTNAYPVADATGKASTPYTFVIKNTCSSTISYIINLEVLNSTTYPTTLSSSYIDLMVDSGDFKLLSSYTAASTSYCDDCGTIKEKYQIKTGTLTGGNSVSTSIRLWMDEDVTATDSMSKTFYAKVTANATISAS